MKKIKCIYLLLFSILFYACGGDESGDSGGGTTPPPEDPKYIEVQNADFDKEIDFSTGAGGWKRENFYKGQNAVVEWDATGGYNKTGCVKISLSAKEEVASVGITQKLTGLKPGTLYRFAARMKYSDISSGRGAVIYTKSNDQLWNASEHRKGSNTSWKGTYVDFISEPDGTAEIVCGLGFRYGGTTSGGFTTGSVWYDDVRVYEITDEAYQLEGEYVKIVLNNKDVLNEEKLKTWVSNLDKIYESYVDLIGDKPFGGDKLIILSTPGIESGYWALAGNPILWNENYVGRTLEQVLTYDDWVFGVMHEMGHDFNGGSFRGKYTANWNWNDEIFANFRMYYALVQNNATVYQNNHLFIGDEIKEMYKSGKPNYSDDNCYDNSIAIGKGNNGNGLMYVMIRLAEDLGWDVYKAAFKDLYKSGNASYANNWEKFQALLNALQKHTDKDVYSLFLEGELDVIKSGLI